MEDYKVEMKRLLAEAQATRKEATAYLLSKGEVVDLGEWVTIKNYCRMFGIENSETVTNWIRRGIIPPENVQVVEELNNLRLVKAVPYHVKTAKAV